jgi:hypothetical protein
MDGVPAQETNAASLSVLIPVLDSSAVKALLPACPDWPDLN